MSTNKLSKTKPASIKDGKTKATETELRAHAPKLEKTPLPAGYGAIHFGIVDLLQAARVQAARSVNALMTASYWEVGHRIVEAEQKGKRRAGYGEQLILRLSADLTKQFGRGFSERNLDQMRVFYTAWPLETKAIPQTVSAESQILQTLSEKLQTFPAISEHPHSTPARLAAIAQYFPLPWSAYVRLLSVKSDPARRFYETEDSLMAITVPVPSIQAQRKFVALKSDLIRLFKTRQEVTSLSEAVVPALISRTMTGC